MQTVSVLDNLRSVIHFFNSTWKGGRAERAESAPSPAKNVDCHPANSRTPYSVSPGITVYSASEEYRHIVQERCSCGGVFLPGLQVAGSSASGHFDVINVACAGCGSVHQFKFYLEGIAPCSKSHPS